MTHSTDFDKVTTVLLQQGEWYEVDPGTFTSIPAANFLSGHSGSHAHSSPRRNMLVSLIYSGPDYSA
jgi:hypothetical protein